MHITVMLVLTIVVGIIAAATLLNSNGRSVVGWLLAAVAVIMWMVFHG